MPNRATALTGAAGEHYVAFRLSEMGYPVALTRGGSPAVDLLVTGPDGKEAISIQVKTSSGARREYKRKPENNCWEWDVGKRAMTLRGKKLFYAFVDLQWAEDQVSVPDVFIVPSDVVAGNLGPDWSRYMFWIYDADKEKYLNQWDQITKLIG